MRRNFGPVCLALREEGVETTLDLPLVQDLPLVLLPAGVKPRPLYGLESASLPTEGAGREVQLQAGRKGKLGTPPTFTSSPRLIHLADFAGRFGDGDSHGGRRSVRFSHCSESRRYRSGRQSRCNLPRRVGVEVDMPTRNTTNRRTLSPTRSCSTVVAGVPILRTAPSTPIPSQYSAGTPPVPSAPPVSTATLLVSTSMSPPSTRILPGSTSMVPRSTPMPPGSTSMLSPSTPMLLRSTSILRSSTSMLASQTGVVGHPKTALLHANCHSSAAYGRRRSNPRRREVMHSARGRTDGPLRSYLQAVGAGDSPALFS